MGALKAWRPEHAATRQTQSSCEALSGYVDVLDGRAEAGIARIERALDASRQSPNAPGAPAFYARVLLDAYFLVGDVRAGLAAADRALEMGSVRLWEAEMRRLRGEFLAMLGAPPQDVEKELESALQVARCSWTRPASRATPSPFITSTSRASPDSSAGDCWTGSSRPTAR